MPRDIHLPTLRDSTEADLWAWYQNSEIELRLGVLNGKHADDFRAYYEEAGLLRWWRRPFFRFHYSRTFARSAAFLLEKAGDGSILDLGCGCGTQSLYLALKGAQVVALDLNEAALGVLQQRKTFYEQLAGRRLDIVAHCADALAFDYGSIALIAGVHSMFAFNMMQPSSKLVDQILFHLVPRARIAILDGNNCSWTPRLLPWRKRAVWSPDEFPRELTQRGFCVVAHEGGAALPPVFWRLLPYRSGAALDRMLSHGWLFPISHLILAERP
jgi:SAM-dependent methyltransferase